MKETFEIIATIVISGMVLGFLATLVFCILVALRSDPDFEDEEDREIYEKKYWDNNK